jgi:hypothetical protein
MRDIFLSSPLLQLYVLHLAALVVVLWLGHPKPRGQKVAGSPHQAGRYARWLPRSADDDASLAARWLNDAGEGRVPLPARQLETCAAQYSTQFSTAAKRSQSPAGITTDPRTRS